MPDGRRGQDRLNSTGCSRRPTARRPLPPPAARTSPARPGTSPTSIARRDAPEIEARPASADKAAQDFAAAHAGKLAAASGAELAAAIAEYERIDEILGRLVTYAQLLFAADSTDAAVGRFYQWINERVTAIGSHLIFFALELNRLDEDALEQKLADPELARWRPWLRDLRVFRPHQLSDEAEKLLHEKEVTGRAAWSRLFDETIAGMRVPVDGEELTVSAALNKLSDRDRGVREAAAKAIGAEFGKNAEALLAHHEHARQGQGDHRHLAPLSAPGKLAQPRQHGRGRGGGRARHRRRRELPAPVASLLRA